MLFVEVCIGSACHIKGAPQIVQAFEEAIKDNRLEDEIVLTGCVCSGRCSKVGVTVKVGDKVYTGITPEGFDRFWKENVLTALKAEDSGIKQAPSA